MPQDNQNTVATIQPVLVSRAGDASDLFCTSDKMYWQYNGEGEQGTVRPQ